jgi:hypothetical protein
MGDINQRAIEYLNNAHQPTEFLRIFQEPVSAPVPILNLSNLRNLRIWTGWLSRPLRGFNRYPSPIERGGPTESVDGLIVRYVVDALAGVSLGHR